MGFFILQNEKKAASKRGFTLIELLVVLSLISLISSVILSSVNSARVKARNSLRANSIKQLELAINLYRDSFGVYPPGEDDSGPSNQGRDDSYVGDFIPILVQQKILPRTILDPINSDQNFYIYIWPKGTMNNGDLLSLNCGATPPAKAALLIVPEGGAIKGMTVSKASPNVNMICFY